MYIRNLLLTCFTLLASTINLLYAAPCYTDTAGGCAENKETILVKTNTTASGEVCTTYTNELNKIVTSCYVPKIESQTDSSSITNISKNQKPQPTPASVTINNITYNTIYPQTETPQQETPVVQNIRDAYWQGYYQNYNNQPFYGYGSGYGHRPPPRPPFYNNHRRPTQGISIGKGSVHLTSPNRPNRQNYDRPRPPPFNHNRPPPPRNQNMRPATNNRVQTQGRTP